MKDWPWYGHLIVALLAFVVFYMVYFKPQGGKLKALKEDRVKVETDVIKLRAKKKELDKIQAEILVLGETLKELEVIIPQEKDISDILRKMHQLAIDSKLNIINFSPEVLVPKEFYYEWPIPIEITGSYHNLAIFFDRLSRFSRLFNIDGFSIRSLGQQTSASTISASFTAKTYIFGSVKPSVKKPAAKRGRR
jgi:Tfp pilus assembly protein PilO